MVFSLFVVDFAGAVIPKAEISGESSDKNFRCVTSEDGSCEIPKCEKFDVVFASYHGTHNIQDTRANVFTVALTNDQLEPVIDEVWLIERNRLFVADSKGVFDQEIWPEKVSPKRTKKPFP